MANTSLTNRSGKQLAKLLILGMLVQLLFIAYVFFQSYDGRKGVVHTQRIGCERAKRDRQANAVGWRIAEAARRAGGQIVVANKYRHIASELEQRSKIDCEKAFPSATVLP